MADAPRDANNVPVLLGVSSSDGTTPTTVYVNPSTHRLLVSSSGGSGDVVGPASSTDNAIVRFDSTTGKLIQNSVVTIADTTGVIAGTQGLTLSGTTSGTTAVVATAVAGTTTITLPAATDTLVGKATTDTLTNKTLTSPVITTSPTAAGSTWTDLGTVTTADINGGTIDGVTIGGAAAGAVTGTTITANTGFMPDANDGAYLGQSGTAFSDLFLASGAVVDFAAGDAVLTHSAGVLTVSTGDLRVTTAGTNAASAVTVGGTQTLTNKTLTSPAINTGTIGTSLVPTANDGAPLGNTTNQFSDLFLAEGGVINWDNGDVTLTQTGNLLALAGGQFSFGANTAYFTETDNGNSGASDTIDWTLSNKQKSTLTDNCTFTFTAPGGPCNLTLKLAQDGTGSRTVTWPAAVHWSGGTAPTLTTTASRIDIISFYYDGTTYFGSSVLNFVA